MITIIIPTYNNEDTINVSIESVINLTYTDWKILIINDCCTDNTLSIVQQYIDKYPEKIQVINNTENVGVGKSRIIGVNNTETDFLTFLDSDDYLLPNFLEISDKLQHQNNSDVIYTGTILYLDENHIKTLEVPDYNMSGRISTSLHINYPKKWLTGKLFRTNLIKNIPMSDKRCFEDVNTLFYICYNAEKVRSSKYCGYVHLFRQNSLINSLDDNQFYLYCESTCCDIEMIDYIIKKEDWEVFTPLVKIPYLNFKRHEKLIDERKIIQEDVNKSYNLWVYITEWFNKHEDLILEKMADN